MSNRITYKCKTCGWSRSITAEWQDLRPKRCGNKKCSSNFLLKPELLETNMPEVTKLSSPKETAIREEKLDLEEKPKNYGKRK